MTDDELDPRRGYNALRALPHRQREVARAFLDDAAAGKDIRLIMGGWAEDNDLTEMSRCIAACRNRMELLGMFPQQVQTFTSSPYSIEATDSVNEWTRVLLFCHLPKPMSLRRYGFQHIPAAVPLHMKPITVSVSLSINGLPLFSVSLLPGYHWYTDLAFTGDDCLVEKHLYVVTHHEVTGGPEFKPHLEFHLEFQH